MVSQKHEEKVELREKAPSWRRSALAGVKAVHSLLYFAIEFCMGYLIYAGLKGREDRRTAMAAGVVGAESLIFLGNRCRCPLTGLAENLGAASGSVTDIYLPGFLASHLVLIHVSLLALALCLHVRNFRRQVKSMRNEFFSTCLLSSRCASCGPYTSKSLSPFRPGYAA